MIEEKKNSESITESDFYPHRVFLNDVQSFHSKYLARLLTTKVHGVLSLSRGGMNGEEEANAEEIPQIIEPKEIPQSELEKYEIIGVNSAPYMQLSEDIKSLVDYNDRATFINEILKCGYIIYDISYNEEEINKAIDVLNLIQDELGKIENLGPKTFDLYPKFRTFILISSILTWSRTKPLDRKDPTIPFTDIDYRKRRAHPNYRPQFVCEKDVINFGKRNPSKLKTYVVCSGVTYGHEEEELEFYFKKAWHNETLPIFGNGNNIIPFVHVEDLAMIIYYLMEFKPNSPQYILAVEQTTTTQAKVIKALAKFMGNERTEKTIPAEAFLFKNMTQTIFDSITSSLNMEPVFITETFQIPFKNDQNLSENMNEIVNEFRIARKLKPVKVVLHGPPCVGKTLLAEKLSKYYNARYVSVTSAIDETITDLQLQLDETRARKAEKSTAATDKTETKEEEEGEEEEIEEEEDNEAIINEQLLEIRTLKQSPHFPEDYAIRILKKYLQKNFSQNQGYILDDFPHTTEDAIEVFGPLPGREGQGEEGEGGILDTHLSSIMPDLVVSLLADDQYIVNRMAALTEEEIEATEYNEFNLAAKLVAFRQLNTEDETVLNYFDEQEVDILLLDIPSDHSENLYDSLQCIIDKLGPPSNPGLTRAELNELHRIEMEEYKLRAEQEKLARELEEERLIREHKNKMESWLETFEKLQMEEEKILTAESEPLRYYLMKYIFPILTKGLVQVVKMTPEDPIDYLAEYLFKLNQEGTMFDPAQNYEGEDTYASFKKEIEAKLAFTEDYR